MSPPLESGWAQAHQKKVVGVMLGDGWGWPGGKELRRRARISVTRRVIAEALTHGMETTANNSVS